MNQTNYAEVDFKTVQTDVFPVYENRPPIVIAHARKAWRRLYLEARNHFRQADRDLGETAAFVAASLTTATAIEAVMTVANDKLGLSKSILQEGFYIYIGIFILILASGLFRGRNALRRRARAEKELRQARKGIFKYFQFEEWAGLEKE